MTKDEALKLALEALEYHTAQTRPIYQTYEAITTIKEALAEPEQEPVAWCWIGRKGWTEYGPIPHDTYPSKPLYAAPLPVQEPIRKVLKEVLELTESMVLHCDAELNQHDVNVIVAKGIEALAQPVQPVQPADLQERFAALHLYEEIAEHYAKTAISPEALRDWVAERMDTPPLPVQPERQWVGLTDEEAQQAFKRHNCDISKDLAGILARAIEAQLKEQP